MDSRTAAAAALAVAACLAAGGARAAPAAEPLRLRLGLHPAAVIWTGEAPGELCAVGRTLQVSTRPFPSRNGAFHRQAELVAEILAPAPGARRVARTASACADAAAAIDDLSAAEGPGASGYGERLTSCLRAKDIDRFVGALTLWIDSDCDL